MKTSTITMAALVISMIALPALAQNEIQCNQPISRTLSGDEIRIEGKIKLDFKDGLIDSTQLAAFNREFDGIMVQEDDLKSRGLNGDGQARIEKALHRFERKLDRSAGMSTTAEANNAVGVRADANNTGLSKLEPTN